MTVQYESYRNTIGWTKSIGSCRNSVSQHWNSYLFLLTFLKDISDTTESLIVNLMQWLHCLGIHLPRMQSKPVQPNSGWTSATTLLDDNFATTVNEDNQQSIYLSYDRYQLNGNVVTKFQCLVMHHCSP